MSNRLKPIRIKGPSFGYCQICSVAGPLTFDHVPPQGASTLTSVEIRTLALSFGGSTTKSTYSQNGVKFRTICAHCNNVKLGANFDPPLIDFSNDLTVYLRAMVDSKLYVGHIRAFLVKPQRIAKAVVGHLLAGCVPEKFDEIPISAPIQDALRKYFLTDSESFPEGMEIYYWLYPSRRQLILNYFTHHDIRFKGFIMASLMKFFPLAFFVVFDKPHSVEIPHKRLLLENDVGLDEVISLSVDFHNIPPATWPEAPGDNNFVLYNDSITMVAQQKPKRNRI